MSALLALLHDGLFLSSKGRAPCSPTCSRAVFSPRPSSFPSPTTYLRVGVLLATPGLLVSHVAGPQREVIAEELHDEGGILVGLLAEGVQLRDGLVESLLGHVARSLGGVEDLLRHLVHAATRGLAAGRLEPLLFILLALLLIAAILIAGVSSIYNGNSEIFFEVSKNLSNCSSEILPRLMSLDLILDCSARILVDNCSEDISSEKKAMEDFLPLSCNF